MDTYGPDSLSILVDEGGEACALGAKHLFGDFLSDYGWYAGGFAHQHGTTLATIGIAEKGRLMIFLALSLCVSQDLKTS